MRVEVTNAYSEQKQTFSGEPEDVKNQLIARFSFLKNRGYTTIHEVLSKLSESQAYFVNVRA